MKQLIALGVILLSFAATAVAEVGDFSIPAVNPLNATQLEALRELVEMDPEAGAIAQEVKQQALPLLDAPPQPLEVIHYAGEKTHQEWINSKVGLDRRRAEAGLEKYQPGRLFDPKYALRVMEEASFFVRCPRRPRTKARFEKV